MKNITKPFTAILFWTYIHTILGSDKQRRVPGNNFNPISNKISAPNYSNLNKNTSPRKLIPSSGSSPTIPKQLLPGESSSSEKSYKQISPKEPNISKAQITNKSLSGKLAYDVQTSKGNQKTHQNSTENTMNQSNLRLKQINLRPENKEKQISKRSSKNSDVPRRIAALINSIHMCQNLRASAFRISDDKVNNKIIDIIKDYKITEETRRIYEMSSNADSSITYNKKPILEDNFQGICKQLGEMLNMNQKDAHFHGCIEEGDVMINRNVIDEAIGRDIGTCTFQDIKFSILLGPEKGEKTYYMLSLSIFALKILEHFYTKPIRKFHHYMLDLPQIIDEWSGKSKPSPETHAMSHTKALFKQLLQTPLEIPNDVNRNSEILEETCQYISAFTEDESYYQFVYKDFKYLGHSNEYHTVKMYKSDLPAKEIKPFGVCSYKNQLDIYVYLGDRGKVNEAYLLAVADKKGRQISTVVLDAIYVSTKQVRVYF